MTSMRFPVNLTGLRSRYEKAVHKKYSTNYHHGNVKKALLDMAASHIENNDAKMISLHALSKEVGITPSAIYNYFASKRALIMAIKIRVYQTEFQ